MAYTKEELSQEKLIELKKDEWNNIEEAVIKYKLQFQDNPSRQDIEASKEAASFLIESFNPLFKKYIILFKTSQIDFNDSDIKSFVGTFIDDPRLHRALKRHKSKSEYKAEIYKRFGFVIETYGKLSEEEILVDLQMLLLVLAKRYKQMGKNFCAYIHNSFKFEISRHIKKYIKNPLNISYKNVSYADFNSGNDCNDTEIIYEDSYYESENGIPNALWINGSTCSEPFMELTSLERKILVKYFSEECNDKQIAEFLGLHINTVNQKRRQAISKLAKSYNIDMSSIKRNRHSGISKDTV